MIMHGRSRTAIDPRIPTMRGTEHVGFSPRGVGGKAAALHPSLPPSLPSLRPRWLVTLPLIGQIRSPTHDLDTSWQICL